jgi:putative flippase GtrA
MMLHQFLRFGLVGALATLVHMLIGATLIHSGWPALAANPVSFLIAFVVSFMGHYGFSFSDQEKEMATTLKRFALVACGGFVMNEALLAVLVWSVALPQIASLILSTGVAAFVTFFASRNWAFRRLPKNSAPRIRLGQ